MSNTTEIVCACGCGRKKKVRMADVKRGWGKYYSKSCKARHQEKKTGQYRRYTERNELGFFEEHEFANAHLFSNED